MKTTDIIAVAVLVGSFASSSAWAWDQDPFAMYFQRSDTVLIRNQFPHALVQPAAARLPPLRSPDPAAQLCHFRARQFSGKRRIRRIEEVMTFVRNGNNISPPAVCP